MKVVAYMVIEIGLALLAVLGFAAGRWLLWPKWLESPVAKESMTGEVLVVGLFLLSCLIYAVRTLGWQPIRWVPMAKLSGLVTVPLAIVMGVLYFWPLIMLPAVDLTSQGMLPAGQGDDLQMTVWTLFSLFGYVPVALASLFWHTLTMFVIWNHNRRAIRAEPLSAKVEPVLATKGVETR